jgi:hypothetical protein
MSLNPRSSPRSSAAVALVCSVVLLSLLEPSTGSPVFSNSRGALKREKRTESCLELKIARESKLTEGSPQPPWGSAELGQFVWFTTEHGEREEGKAEGGGERDMEMCKGRSKVGSLEDDVIVLMDSAQLPARIRYILFPEMSSISDGPVTVRVTCAHDPSPRCFTLLSDEHTSSSEIRLRRAAQDTHHSTSLPDGEKAAAATSTSGIKRGVVWLCVSAAGLVGLLAALAMCAHSSQQYEPEVTDSRTTDEVAAPSESTTTAASKSESMVNLLNEGSASFDEGKSATTSMASSEGVKLAASQQSGSQEPLVQPGNETSEDSRLPTLETADGPRQVEGAENSAEVGEEGREDEDGGGYASVKKPSGKYDYVDKTASDGKQNGEDEAGYAYATVGGAMGKGPSPPAQPTGNGGGAGEVGGRGGKEDKEKSSGLPPYGKVTRHMVPVAKKSGYSEVRTSSPMLPPGRPRAVTEPVDPDSHEREGQGRGVRDERAFTESAAHLPLPQIPKLDVSDQTYDSIPDELREGASTPADGAGDRSSGSVAKPNGAPVRESLYESVEVDEAGNVEVDEDMYESVPEDMKPMVASASSPDTLSPISPLPPPPRSPSINRTKTEGATTTTPPASPLTKERPEDVGKKKGKEHVGKETKSEQKKHKALSKAKSDTGTETRGRSLSSMFTRKKPGNIAASNTPLSPKAKKQHKPLPKVPTAGAVPSPTHLLPPSPPPMPAPPPPDEEEEEDEYPEDSPYDMIDVLNPRGAALLKNGNAARAKSASLPSSMRTAGPSMLHHGHGPLPDVPEESAGGLVARQRVHEDMDPEYDTVVLGQVTNDPSYDSVEVGHGGGEAMPKLEPAEPPSTPPPPAAAAGEGGGGGQTPANKYARVSSHAAVDSTFSPPDLSAYAPEHDELGYAMIPAHLKMRKRAMSDAAMKRAEERKKSRPKSVEMVDDLPVSSDVPVNAGGGEDMQRVPSPPMEPEYESVTDALKNVSEPAAVGKNETPYASVDMAAKRKSHLLKQHSGAANDAEESLLREASPNPPPLPQQGDLGDLSEFQRPPVPHQAEASLELIDPSGSDLQPPSSGIVNPYSQIDLLANDPPYASVKKKEQEGQTGEESKAEAGDGEENPYSIVLDNSDGIVSLPDQSDPPYAKVQNGRVVGGREQRDEEDPGPGYAKAGSKRLAEDGSFEPGNGAHFSDNGEGDEDTYDRLDHGLGSTSCRAALSTSPGPDGESEYSTVTVDFSTSPELVVTHTDSVRREENGVVRQVEETTISFAE